MECFFEASTAPAKPLTDVHANVNNDIMIIGNAVQLYSEPERYMSTCT